LSIQSFVLQNFFNPYPINSKTTKTFYAVLLKYNSIILLNVLGTFSQLNQINKYYHNPFLIFLFIFKKLHNTLKLNLVLSLKYSVLKTLLYKINNNPKYCISKNKSLLTHNTFGMSRLKTIKYTSIPFYKYDYNKLIYLILYKLVTMYQPYNNTHVFTVKNLPLKINFFFFTFLNLFYFKIRNY